MKVSISHQYPDRTFDIEDDIKYVPIEINSVGGLISHAAVPWDSVFGLDLTLHGGDLSTLDERFEITWWGNDYEGLVKGLILDTFESAYCMVNIVKVARSPIPPKDIPFDYWIISVDHRNWKRC